MARYRRQQIDIPLMQGMNQSIDSKLAPVGGLELIENAVFTKHGQLARRNGFDFVELETIDELPPAGPVRRLAKFGDKPLFCTTRFLYEYSPTLGKLSQVRGPLPEASAPTRIQIAREADRDHQECAVVLVNGFRIYAWIAKDAGPGAGAVPDKLFAEVRTSDGTVLWRQLVGAAAIAANNLKSLRLLRAESNAIVLWEESGTGASQGIYSSILDCTSTPTAWATSVKQADLFGPPYEACSNGSAVYVALDHGGWTVVRQYDASMTQVGQVDVESFVGTGPPKAVFADDTYVVVAWKSSATEIRYAVFDTDLVPVLSPTVAISDVNFTADSLTISPADEVAGTYAIWAYAKPDGAHTRQLLSSAIRSAVVTDAGAVVVADGTTWHWVLASRVVRHDRRFFAVLFNSSAVGAFKVSQRSSGYYLCEVYSDAFFARRPRPICALITDGLAYEGNLLAPTDIAVDGSTWHIALPEVFALDDFAGTAGTTAFTVSMDDTQNLLPCEYGGAVYFSGGIVTEYDGSAPFEVGFVHPPREAEAYDKVAGTLTRAFAFTYAWRDATGKWHESAPGAFLTVENYSQVNLRVSTLTVTQKQVPTVLAPAGQQAPVLVRVYATLDNGTVFYLLHDVANDPNAEFVEVPPSASVLADTALAQRAVLYTEGGVLPHRAPFAAQHLAVWDNRLCAAQASHVLVTNHWDGELAPQFVVGNSHRVDAAGSENLTTLAVMDDALVMFKPSSVHVVSGQGPNLQGAPPYPTPRAVSPDVGCIEPRSVVTTQVGVAFQSQRGITMLPRGFGAPLWIGEAVQDEETAFPRVLAALNMADRHSVVFLVGTAGEQSSLMLAFDYARQAWLRWNLFYNPVLEVQELTATAYSQAVTGAYIAGRLILAESEALYIENPASAADAALPIPVTVRTHQYRPGGMFTGFRRGCAVRVLGTQIQPTSLQLVVATDDRSGPDGTYTWTFTNAAPLRGIVEHVLKNQRANSFQFTLVDTGTDGTEATHGLALNALALDVVSLPGGMPLASEERR
jgi:hypothetical protein